MDGFANGQLRPEWTKGMDRRNGRLQMDRRNGQSDVMIFALKKRTASPKKHLFISGFAAFAARMTH